MHRQRFAIGLVGRGVEIATKLGIDSADENLIGVVAARLEEDGALRVPPEPHSRRASQLIAVTRLPLHLWRYAHDTQRSGRHVDRP